MKIRIMGTSAAEGIPGLFCTCATCMKSLELGGRNIRTRSQTVINDKYLVDFPPDSYKHVLDNRLNLAAFSHLIVTHAHIDHFFPEDLQFRRPPFGYNSAYPPLTVYGSGDVISAYQEMRGKNRDPSIDEYVKTFEMKAFETYRLEHGDVSCPDGGHAMHHLTDDGHAVHHLTDDRHDVPHLTDDGHDVPRLTDMRDCLSVTPLPALHDRSMECFIFVFESGGKRLLYGHDTGFFPEKSMEHVKSLHFDCVILDCTTGLERDGGNHMGVEDNLQVRDEMMNAGCADGSTVFIMSHFSHNGGLTHDDLEAIATRNGFIAAYDGFEISF